MPTRKKYYQIEIKAITGNLKRPEPWQLSGLSTLVKYRQSKHDLDAEFQIFGFSSQRGNIRERVYTLVQAEMSLFKQQSLNLPLLLSNFFQKRKPGYLEYLCQLKQLGLKPPHENDDEKMSAAVMREFLEFEQKKEWTSFTIYIEFNAESILSVY